MNMDFEILDWKGIYVT